MGITPEQDREITELYHEMFQMLFQYANVALQNRTIAEAAVQDTFRIACGSPDACLGSPNPKGWLLEALKNVIRNIRRSQTRQNRLSEKLLSIAQMQANADEDAPNDDIDSLKGICIKVLGEDEFRLFWRVTMDRLTMAEAALEFGINTEACKKRIQRAKIKLKDYIKNFC